MSGSIGAEDDAAWMARARTIDGATCDAVFHWAADVYYGPANDFSPAQWRELREILPPPALPTLGAGGDIASAALLGREDELVAHCRRIVGIAERRGKPGILLEPLPCFRVQTVIHDGISALTSPAWHDTEAEAREQLGRIAAQSPRDDGEDSTEVFDAIDQGWQLRMVRRGDRLFVREWNWENPDETESVELSLDLATMAADASAALGRLRLIHGRLVAALGVDYWNYRR